MRDASTQPADPAQPAEGLEAATFAAGRFGGVEAGFRRVEGVVDAAVGCCGGRTGNPTYRQMCTGRTDHAETSMAAQRASGRSGQP
jgi:peptide methionine sulfoxide reductase MsrA